MVENGDLPGQVPVAIFGGHSGTIVSQAIRDIALSGGPLRTVGFLNDVEPAGSQIDGSPVLGRFDEWRLLPENTIFFAVLHKAKEAKARWKTIRELEIPDDRWATVIHPSAHIAQNVEVGVGTYIGPNAVLMPGVSVGRHVSLRAGCYVSHDVSVGDFCFIGPNAVLNGRSALGRGAHFGPAACCREKTRIGAYAVVGLGAVVITDVRAHAVVVGNPARAIG